MERILVVEGDAKIRGLLDDYLTLQGYRVTAACDGKEALDLSGTVSPDLIILDLMMPRMDGFTFLERYRKDHRTVPVLILTAKGEEVDKLQGFDLGADDYVTKPFSIKVLHARVRAHLRRTKRVPKTPETYSFGDVTIDFMKRTVTKNDEEVRLSAMEFKVLRYFVLHKEEAISRDRLLDEVWGYESFPTTRTVDTHVLNLRKKIEDNPNTPCFFITVHGVGYKFVGEGA